MGRVHQPPSPARSKLGVWVLAEGHSETCPELQRCLGGVLQVVVMLKGEL